MVRRNVFQMVGGFDEDFFTLGDDIDLCWRLKLRGYKTMINPWARAYHKVSATLSKRRRWQLRYFSERNTIRMLIKNYGRKMILLLGPIYFCILCAEFFTYCLVGRFDMAYAVAKAVGWNLKNIFSTIEHRKVVQRTRVIDDTEVLKRMKKTIYKIDYGLRLLKGQYTI
jgi:hypothetical protein